jgi:hypothetical protein
MGVYIYILKSWRGVVMNPTVQRRTKFKVLLSLIPQAVPLNALPPILPTLCQYVK